MTGCTAVIAALPREVKGLVKGWERRPSAENVWVWTDGRDVVACAGMGAVRVRLAVDAAMGALPVTRLISVGLAGACDVGLKVGEVVLAGVVIDAATGERFGDEGSGRVVVSVDQIVSVGEKARLRAEYGADAVDMEAAAVGRMARERGLEFAAIKAISDESGFAMEGLGRFADAEGQFREGAFAMYAALRPAMWGKVIALGRNSGAAVVALTRALRAELDLED
jgi:adenosylhomocysteine nucleosidase